MSFRNEIKNKISDACILVNGAVAITGAGAENAAKRLDKRKKRSNIPNLCTIHRLHK